VFLIVLLCFSFLYILYLDLNNIGSVTLNVFDDPQINGVEILPQRITRDCLLQLPRLLPEPIIVVIIVETMKTSTITFIPLSIFLLPLLTPHPFLIVIKLPKLINLQPTPTRGLNPLTTNELTTPQLRGNHAHIQQLRHQFLTVFSETVGRLGTFPGGLTCGDEGGEQVGGGL